MDRKSKKREYDREWVTFKRLTKLQKNEKNAVTEETVIADETVMANETSETNALEIRDKKHEEHNIKDDENENLNLETEHMSKESEISDDDLMIIDKSNSDMATDIKSWSLENGIAHNALDGLLKLLKKHGSRDLPSCSRTLLNSPRTANIEKRSGMEYVYFGLKIMLQNHMQKYSPETTEKIGVLELKLNIDGLPLFICWTDSHLSNKLENLRKSIPSVFARRPRGLSEIDRWKATEYRQLMLYTGKIVFRGILKQELYNNFMCFSTAMCILVNPGLTRKHWQYARDLMKYFVLQCRELYGEGFLVYNVHQMLHIADVARQFEGLDECSAFAFENFNQRLKRMVHSGRNPLAQVTKRLLEGQNMQMRTQERPIKCTRPNNFFGVEQTFFEVIEEDGLEKQSLLCRVYDKTAPLYTDPCDSRIVGSYVGKARETTIRRVLKSELKSQAIMTEHVEKNKIIFLYILHTDQGHC